jgi:hypothetical protein
MKNSITKPIKKVIIITILITQTLNTTSMFEKLHQKCPKHSPLPHLKQILSNQLNISASPPLSNFTSPSTLLISAIVTFRHGDRTTGRGADLKHFNQINCSKYQVLTPMGAKRLVILGQLLFRRYRLLVNSSSLFITSAKNRCLQSLLNFLQGFRELGVSSWSKGELLKEVEGRRFFEERDFTLLHDCKGPDAQFPEVAGNGYGVNAGQKKSQKPPDSSEDQDDDGEGNANVEVEKDVEIVLIYSVQPDALRNFKHQVNGTCPVEVNPVEKRSIKKITRKTNSKNQKRISSKNPNKKPESEQKSAPSSYLQILQSILDQIFFSRFKVFLSGSKSFFSGNRSLGREESSYSRLCQNYAMTLKKDMWRFHKGEQQDIKFCFYNTKQSNDKHQPQGPFFFQQGIFVAEKGTAYVGSVTKRYVPWPYTI